MKISDVLKSTGLPSKEIKIRLANKRILLNGEIITTDLELGNHETDKDGTPITQDIGDFIFNILDTHPQVTKFMSTLGCNFESLIGTNLKGDMFTFLNEHNIIRFSKKDAVVIRKF